MSGRRRQLQPLLDELETNGLAHSLRFVLPRMIAPASRIRLTRKASCCGLEPTRASEPAVVAILSAVSMLSLISTGMPCSGPRSFVLRSASSASAILERVGIDFEHTVDGRPLLIDAFDARDNAR